ncbi:Ribose 1,5-bisphosphate phosphokinase PhnN [Cedecea davisae]|uniref:Ribose 1,5-bisphosphate phosphokinase PhnN n=3 Tax=Enterobacteriaceae TaxID=543 RepID=S3J3I7_9ENTR|nr:phosphonate metabolism protein/1,5-bisphosphokinase PhnN [Cedecea davisae DSM 4568]MBU4681706.1 ribose 1,5-bisphosphokinase [Cedecea davisae]MBU4689226.1 ribose 1,5-bisphosphokinase [Cedecea davisae]QIX95486.1 ribose 1,5-bisphosphokinase [Cedecea sp. FDAARGOS_727]SUX36793.1 Ribose 1,5-bisphosphate phosphokinase PhnN [Cedecea davisae]
MSKLIWLMGPSGSGKDSLLSALRQQEHERLLVAHRYITRAADAGCENHVALSAKEFDQRQQQGLFALSWQAHHQSYGVGVEMDIWLEAGFDVVVNGSRQHLQQARERYAEALVPICLQVSTDVLRYRLEQRGRENAEQIEQRLQRAALYAPEGDDCLVLNNDGSLLQSAELFMRLLARHRSNVIPLHRKEPRHV